MRMVLDEAEDHGGVGVVVAKWVSRGTGDAVEVGSESGDGDWW